MYRGRGQVGFGGGGYGARGNGGPNRNYGGRGYGGDRRPQRNNRNNNGSSFSGVRDGILNYPMGSSISPSEIQRWASEWANVLAEQCPNSELTLIVNDDGTPAEGYPERDEPEMPDADDPDIVNLRFNYQEAMKIRNKYYEQRRIERVKAVRIALNRLGPDSQARVRETLLGRQAIANNDPLALLEQIFLCHSTDFLLETEQNAVMAMRRFHSITQGETETTGKYYIRFKATRQAMITALETNGDDAEAQMPSDAAQAVMFIVGMNNGYRRFKNSFVDGTNEAGYPVTLAAAYERALRATFDSNNFNRQRIDFRGVFAAQRGGHQGRGDAGRGGGRGNAGRGGGGRGYQGRGYNNYGGSGYNNYGGGGYHQNHGGGYNNQAQHQHQHPGGRGGGRGRGRGPRLCYICREEGHLAAQCPHRDDAVIDEAIAEMNADGTGNGA
jgi:Zinc knuckle